MGWFRSNTDTRLRQLLRERVQTLSRTFAEQQAPCEAVSTKGLPASDDSPTLQAGITALKDLAWLCDSLDLDEERLRSSRNRWRLFLYLTVLLGIVSLLLFCRTRTTDIELEAAAQGVSYTLTETHGILDTVRLAELGLGGVSLLKMPSPSSGHEDAIASIDSQLRVRLTALDGESGRITLNALVAPPSTLIVLRTSDIADQLVLSLTPAPGTQIRLDLSLHGKIKVVVHGGNEDINELRDYGATRNVSSYSSQSLTLDLTPLLGQAIAFPGEARLKDLSFMFVDRYSSGQGLIAREVSGLRSGILYLESLNGKAVNLRSAEQLRFTSLAGVLRTLALEKSDLRLHAGPSDTVTATPAGALLKLTSQATVDDVTIGWADNRRSLKPTVLEWLAARQSLTLLWAAALSVGGIILGVLKWLGLKT